MAYYYSPFRKEYTDPLGNGCPFCDQKIIRGQSIQNRKGVPVGNEYYFWIANWYPRSEAASMIIPRRHVLSLGEETESEVLAREDILVCARQAYARLFPGSGIEIYIQTGSDSQGTIPHLHWHLHPTLPDDPLPGLGKYEKFYTMEEGKEKVVMYPVEIKLAREKLIEAFKPFT